MIFLLLAFVLAAIAGYLVFDKVRTLNAELGGMTKIYVAAGDIPSRTLITENQIKTIEIPNRYVSESYVTKMNELVKKVVVVPLKKDDIITGNMLKPVTELRKANDRLVAMYRSDKIQFDQVVTTNDRVDIIVSTGDKDQKKTEIFMRDVPVAWAQGEGEKFIGAALEVSLEDAPKLINMQNYADHIRILKANVGRENDEPTAENQQIVTEQQTNQKSAKNSDHKSGNTTTNHKVDQKTTNPNNQNTKKDSTKK